MDTQGNARESTNKSTNVRAIPWQLRLLRLAAGVLGRISPRLAARGMLALFRTPRRYPSPLREQGWLAAARRFTVHAGAHRFAGYSWGTGPTVLLVHGWESRAGQLGGFATALAAAGYRAVAFDSVAHGASSGRRSSLPEHAAATAAVAAEVGPLAGVIAHSFGVAAVCYALERGELESERLVFVSAPADLDPYTHRLAGLLGLSDEVRRLFIARLEERFGITWRQVRRITLEAARPLPLLVVHDEDDDETPVAGARALAEAWPVAELEITRGLGHRRILRHRPLIERAVTFLARRDDGRAVASAG